MSGCAKRGGRGGAVEERLLALSGHKFVSKINLSDPSPNILALTLPVLLAPSSFTIREATANAKCAATPGMKV